MIRFDSIRFDSIRIVLCVFNFIDLLIFKELLYHLLNYNAYQQQQQQSISTNESSFVRPSMYNEGTSTKPKISVSTPETVPEDLASYKERSSRSRCSSPATSVASSKHSRRSVQSTSNNNRNAPHTSTMRRQQQQQVSSSSYSVLDFVPPPPPPPPPRGGSPTHSAGGSKSRRRSASLEPRRLALGNGDGTSYNNHDGGCIKPVSPPLINRAPASDAPVAPPRRSVSLEPRRSPAAVMNHHTAAPPLPSIPIAPRYNAATTNTSASGRRSTSNEAAARGRRSSSAGPPVASSVNRMAMTHSVDRWMESKVAASNNANTTASVNTRSRSMSLSAGERSNHQQYQQQQHHAYYSSPATTPPRSPHSRHSPRSHSSPSSEGRKSPYTSLYVPGCGNAGDESSGSAYPPSTDDSSPLMNRHVPSSSAFNQKQNKAISSTRYSPPRQELIDAISTVSRELEKMSASGSDNDATAVDRNTNGRYLCEVARGPLRVIIDTGSHTDDRPLLYSINPASPLSGKANEGDVIFKVDGVDTKGMTGERLAKLVKRKQAGSDADPKVCKLIIMSSNPNKSQTQC